MTRQVKHILLQIEYIQGFCEFQISATEKPQSAQTGHEVATCWLVSGPLSRSAVSTSFAAHNEQEYEPQAVQLHLQRARQAADAAAAALKQPSAVGAQNSPLHPATEAVDALMWVASAMTTPASQGLIDGASAAEAYEVATHLARVLAECEHRHAMQCAQVARDLTASRCGRELRDISSAAVQAKESAALAMWAASLGGVQMLRDLRPDLDASMRAADEAVDLAATAAAAAQASMAGSSSGNLGPSDPWAGATAAGTWLDGAVHTAAADVGSAPGVLGDPAEEAGPTAEGLGLPAVVRSAAFIPASSGADGDTCAAQQAALAGSAPGEMTCSAATRQSAAAEAPLASAAAGTGALIGSTTDADADCSCRYAGAPFPHAGAGFDSPAVSAAAPTADFSGSSEEASCRTADQVGEAPPLGAVNTPATAPATPDMVRVSSDGPATCAVHVAAAATEQALATEPTPLEGVASAVGGLIPEAGAEAALEPADALAHGASPVAAPVGAAAGAATARPSTMTAAPGHCRSEAEGADVMVESNTGSNGCAATVAVCTSAGAATDATARIAHTAAPPQSAAFGEPAARSNWSTSQQEVLAPQPDAGGARCKQGDGGRLDATTAAPSSSRPQPPLEPQPSLRSGVDPVCFAVDIFVSAVTRANATNEQLRGIFMREACATFRSLFQVLTHCMQRKHISRATQAALTAPATRCAAATLWVYVIRWLCRLLDAQIAMSSGEVQDTLSTFDALVGYDAVVSSVLSSTGHPDVGPQAEETRRLWAKTDMVQCLSCALSKVADIAAAAITAAAGGAAAATASSVNAQEPAGALGVPWRITVPDASTAVIPADYSQIEVSSHIQLHIVAELISIIFSLISPGHGSWLGDVTREIPRLLRKAMLGSRLFEHLVRAVVLTHRAFKPRTADEGCVAANGISMLESLLHDVLTLARCDSKPIVVWSDVLVSGPCVQHFLLLHIVAQLCMVDHGPTYGLPADALLPAVVDVSLSNTEEEGSTAVITSQWVGTFLSAKTLRWWATHRARPCSDRALRVVCERVMAVVSAIWETDAATASSGGGGGGQDGRLCFHPLSVLELGTAALECALAVIRRGATGPLSNLWAPVMRMADAVSRRMPVPWATPTARSFPLLVLEPLPEYLEPFGGCSGQLGSNLAALLEQGYVAAMERAIRAALRGGPAACRAVFKSDASIALSPLELSGISDNRVHYSPQHCIGGLMFGNPNSAHILAYGDLLATAALMCTKVKVFCLTLETVLEGDDVEDGVQILLTMIASLSGFTVVNTSNWSMLEDTEHQPRWWRRHLHHAASQAAAAGATADGPTDVGASDGTGEAVYRGRQGESGGARAAAGDDGGSGLEGDGLQGALSPSQQMSLLTCLTLSRFLMGLRRLLDVPTNTVARSRANDIMANGIIPMVDTVVSRLVNAYLDCRDRLDSTAAETLDNAPGASAGTGAAGFSGSGVSRTATGPRPAAGAGQHVPPAGFHLEDDPAGLAASTSWEQLLLEQVDLPDLLRQAACSLALCRKEDVRDALQSYTTALLHVIVAFPCQGRSLLQETVTRSTKLLPWLRDAITGLGITDADMRHFLELAPAVAAGGQPGPQDVVRLRANYPDAVRAGAMLPPPCVVAAALRQLHLCANPLCTNMAGNSEAELLQLRDGMHRRGNVAGGSSTESYCSKMCCLKHRQAKRTAAGAGRKGR